MLQCSRHTVQQCIFVLGFLCGPRYLMISCCGVFWGGGGQGDALRWWWIFVLFAICIFLWSFYILCHGCDCFSDCCSFSFHDYCNYTPALVSQLASCLPKMMVLHGTVLELLNPYFMKFVELLWNLNLHLLLSFWWPENIKQEVTNWPNISPCTDVTLKLSSRSILV